MRDRWRIFTPLVALVFVLGACSSNNNTGASSAASAAASSAASQAAAASTGGQDISGQTVTVIGTWTDTEEQNFLAMIKPWEDQTGATVKYQGTRSINDILAAGIPTGVLPDLAGLPGPGQMNEYVQEGALQPLDNVLDVSTYTSETSPGLVQLGQVNGKTYGVFIKASVKGLIWYVPSLHDYSTNTPATWSDLMTQAKANQGNAKAIWCLGIENGAASGWPATDWIEQILLHQAGPDVYNQWWQGKIAWTDPAIKAAFQVYMNDVVANTFGGGTNAAATSFDVAGDPLFTSPPGCEIFQQASFITGLGAFKGKTAGTDYNAFPFPGFGNSYDSAVEGAGDLFGMFHNTPASASLMRYLVTAPAQDIWVKAGGALSANKNATDYPDQLSKTMGAMVANAQQFVFDASDQMPTAMNADFWAQMVSLTAGKESIDDALNHLAKTAQDAYASSS
jgi:alpha-glucoside transport system substrate-binding protein